MSLYKHDIYVTVYTYMYIYHNYMCACIAA